MNPQSPKTSAPCALPVEPAAAVVPNEAVATDEAPPPVANTESAMMIREQDRLMPVAKVSRIMRQVLPPYAKISDDAKEVIQECVSEFISFVTGEANERCHTERRKTVTSEDIVWAMNHLGFDDYVAPVGTFLQRMRESEGGEERSPGRGSRRGSSVVTLPLNGSAQQMHHPAAVCRHPPHQGVSPAAGYAARPVPRPVPTASGAATHFGGRSYQMYGGDHRPVVPCYGGGAAFVQAGGSHQHVGFHADEASSSNESPPAGRAGSH
ncbi:nuclear transcription factor Y subunit B-6-like [Miscanthus floridulus]|uniref:nuclear transcription factor Y subunit B-6-like n=1 Tax=Miscanthus floridulus TaxID=154761 RepID=UPI00345A46F5